MSDPRNHDPASPALADETWHCSRLRDRHRTDLDPHWRLLLLAAHENDHPGLRAVAPARPARARSQHDRVPGEPAPASQAARQQVAQLGDLLSDEALDQVAAVIAQGAAKLADDQARSPR